MRFKQGSIPSTRNGVVGSTSLIGASILGFTVGERFDAFMCCRTMSEAEKEAQRRSFAYGNAHIENERVTRAMIDEAAEKIGKAE